MAKVKITCPMCRSVAEKEKGGVNRSRRIGAPVYCGKTCSGLARRINKSSEQKKAEKADYDRAYRERDPLTRKAKKAAYHKRTYDPIKAAVDRKKRMPAHVEYCRQPDYRAYKKSYDRKRRAKIQYGPFAESFLTLLDLETEVLSRASRYEIDLQAGRLNKATKRKREYEKTIGC